MELLSKNSEKIRFLLIADSASVWQLPAVCLVSVHPVLDAFFRSGSFRMMPPKLRIEQDGRRTVSVALKGRANMSMQRLKLNDEDRRVYETWRRHIILLWAFIVGTMAIVCTVLALDASVTPEQRVLLSQQSGFYP